MGLFACFSDLGACFLTDKPMDKNIQGVGFESIVLHHLKWKILVTGSTFKIPFFMNNIFFPVNHPAIFSVTQLLGFVTQLVTK